MQAIMRMWLGRGEGNVRLIKKIEKKTASPIGKKTAVVMRTRNLPSGRSRKHLVLVKRVTI